MKAFIISLLLIFALPTNQSCAQSPHDWRQLYRRCLLPVNTKSKSAFSLTLWVPHKQAIQILLSSKDTIVNVVSYIDLVSEDGRFKKAICKSEFIKSISKEALDSIRVLVLLSKNIKNIAANSSKYSDSDYELEVFSKDLSDSILLDKNNELCRNISILIKNISSLLHSEEMYSSFFKTLPKGRYFNGKVIIGVE